MRIAFIGASHFGLRALTRLESIEEITVVGVLTAGQRFSISYAPQGVNNVLHAEFGPTASRLRVPCVLLSGPMNDPALVDLLKSWRPDAFLVVGWYHLIPRSLRNIAPAYGMHASLLPDYSGGAPLVWALINGERKTGITLFQMDGGVDTGDIVAQATVPILFNDTIATLYARVEEAGISLLHTHLPRLASGDATFTPQDSSRRRIMPQRSPEDGAIDWAWSALDIYNFVRAQTHPYPGAFTFLGRKRIAIWEAKLFDHPGKHGGRTFGGGEILSCLDQGPLRGILVATANGDHPILLTRINDEIGSSVSLDDGGRTWLTAFSERHFSNQRTAPEAI